MTALAMIVGMIPMSLGIGEGAEQNAPLGRAVIGGLLVATISTLFFVPVVYSYSFLPHRDTKSFCRNAEIKIKRIELLSGPGAKRSEERDPAG